MSKKPYMARIGEAAKALGVSTATARGWEDSGKITATRSLGGQRRYDTHKDRLLRFGAELVVTICEAKQAVDSAQS